MHSPAPPRREASSSATLFPGTADVNHHGVTPLQHLFHGVPIITARSGKRAADRGAAIDEPPGCLSHYRAHRRDRDCRRSDRRCPPTGRTGAVHDVPSRARARTAHRDVWHLGRRDDLLVQARRPGSHDQGHLDDPAAVRRTLRRRKDRGYPRTARRSRPSRGPDSTARPTSTRPHASRAPTPFASPRPAATTRRPGRSS